MRILHVIPSLSPIHGGPSYAMEVLARGLSSSGVDVHIATTDDDGPGRRAGVPLGEPVSIDGAVRFYFKRQTRFYKFSRPMTRWLAHNVESYDLVHVHALFSYASYSACRLARSRGIPYIIRPLGVLNKWGMEKRRPALKRLSLRLIESRLIAGAAAMHYTSEQERREAESWGVRAPGVVIPIGIEVSTEVHLPDPFIARFPFAAGRRVALFLSRIDPKKGLEILIEAFRIVREQEPLALLVIAGEGPDHYKKALKRLADDLGVGDSILWTGFLQGADKQSALAASRVFVLPSYSENLGIAPLEAMAAGVPCVLSDHVAIAPDVERSGAGFVVSAQPDLLATALLGILKDGARQQEMASKAKDLVRSRFGVGTMVSELLRLYERTARREHDKGSPHWASTARWKSGV
ncbi:MAG: glycosyltransferase [Blastocatellia bacterium]